MFHRSVRVLVSCVVLSSAGFGLASAGDPVPARAPVPQLEYLYVEFTGLDEAKGAAVEKAVAGVKGVRFIVWTVRPTEAKVVREVGLAADATLIAAAKGAGATTAGVVPITEITLTFVDQLHCEGCMKVVVTALKALPSVKEVTVGKTLETVAIVYDTRTGKIADFEKALADTKRPVKPSTPPPVTR